MGPLPGGDGDATTAWHAEMGMSASMGPSPGGDGDVIGVCCRVQRGKWLQWGRRPEATEIRLVRKGGEGMSSFNGAVARRRRRSSDHRAEAQVARAASMGPSPGGDGDPPVAEFATAATRASMGPSPGGDGDPNDAVIAHLVI